MAISKKKRFEVFKRDGFQCVYCGKSPPETTLELDHIDPKSKGGDDDLNNLITACFDCNRGKRNIPLDKIPNKLQQDIEILEEKESQLKEYRRFVAKIKARQTREINKINKIYSDAYPGWKFTDTFKQVSLRGFLKRLPLHEIEEALAIAISRFPDDKDTVINYFCGVCWKKIKGNEP